MLPASMTSKNLHLPQMMNSHGQVKSNVFSNRFKSVNVTSPLDLPSLHDANQMINVSRFNTKNDDKLGVIRKQKNQSSLMEIQLNDDHKNELSLLEDNKRAMIQNASQDNILHGKDNVFVTAEETVMSKHDDEDMDDATVYFNDVIDENQDEALNSGPRIQH